MATRAITGTIYHPGGNTPWAGARITIALLSPFSILTTAYPAEQIDVITGTDGTFTTTLVVPTTGTALYQFEIPGYATFRANIASGAALDLTTLFAIVGSSVASTTSAIDAHALVVASTTQLGHVKIDGTTITIAGGVISSTGGGGGGGAPSGPAGGVLGGTYPNPAFAADMATQAELDAHTSLATTAHGGIPLLGSANTFTANQTIAGKLAVGRTPAFSTTLDVGIITAAIAALVDSSVITSFGSADVIPNVFSYMNLGLTSVPSSGFPVAAGIYQYLAISAGIVPSIVYGQFNRIVNTATVALPTLEIYTTQTEHNAPTTIASYSGVHTQLWVRGTIGTGGATVTTAIIVRAELSVDAGNTVTTGYGVFSRPTLPSGSIVGTYAAFRGRMNSVNAGATVTNMYGLWIDKMVGGSTIQRAILTDGGTVHFKTGTATVVGAMIQAFTAQSADLLQLLASDGTTKLSYFDSAGDLFLPVKTANTVYAGPASGAAARPTFRALVALDLGTGAAGAGAKVLADNLTWVTPSGGGGQAPTVADFTASGSSVIPAGAVFAGLMVRGAHGGGGSGRRGAAGTDRYGGGGGAGGGITEQLYSVAALGGAGATLTVTIGAGGAGGAARTADDTDGANGTVGGNTTISIVAGTLVSAVGGPGGSGGTNAAGAAGAAGSAGTSQYPGVAGGASSVAATAAAGTSAAMVAGSAGGGGGVSAANVQRAGGSGASGARALTAATGTSLGGAGGTAGGGAGGAGVTPVAMQPGDGGGGGGGNSAGTGGTGGAGAKGPGGGGGASVNGSNSGAGGAGDAGEARIVYW